MIGLPKDNPAQMLRKLKKHFRKTKTVNVAYLLWMVKAHEASYLLVLGSSLPPEELFPDVGEICKPYLDGNC